MPARLSLVETPFDQVGRWRRPFVDTLIVTAAALCSAPAVYVMLSRPHIGGRFPVWSPVAIASATGFFAWLLVRVVRRWGVGNAFWVAPLFGVLNSGVCCFLVLGSGASAFDDALGLFAAGLVFGSVVGSVLGLAFGTVIALVFVRLRRWEKSGELDASLGLLGSASVAFAGIAVLHRGLHSMVDANWQRIWSIPPELSVLLANVLALVAIVQHARVAIWLSTVHSSFAVSDGVLTFRKQADGPFRGGQHTIGAVRTPNHYAVRAGLLALLLGTEASLWLL